MSLSPAQCVAIRSENKHLKAQIFHLKKRLLKEKSKQQTLLYDDDDSSTCSVDSKLSDLQAKLKAAGDEAKAARKNSDMVSMKAEKWKEKFQKMKNPSIRVSTCTLFVLYIIYTKYVLLMKYPISFSCRNCHIQTLMNAPLIQVCRMSCR